MNQVDCKTDFDEIQILADCISPVYITEMNSEDSSPSGFWDFSKLDPNILVEKLWVR